MSETAVAILRVYETLLLASKLWGAVCPAVHTVRMPRGPARAHLEEPRAALERYADLEEVVVLALDGVDLRHARAPGPRKARRACIRRYIYIVECLRRHFFDTISSAEDTF